MSNIDIPKKSNWQNIFIITAIVSSLNSFNVDFLQAQAQIRKTENSVVKNQIDTPITDIIKTLKEQVENALKQLISNQLQLVESSKSQCASQIKLIYTKINNQTLTFEDIHDLRAYMDEYSNNFDILYTLLDTHLGENPENTQSNKAIAKLIGRILQDRESVTSSYNKLVQAINSYQLLNELKSPT